MNKSILAVSAIAAAAFVAAPAIAAEAPDGAGIFSKKCAMCHMIDKKKVGPAVNTMNRDAETLRSVIADGRKMMPKYSGKLSVAEIDAVVAYLKSQQGE